MKLVGCGDWVLEVDLESTRHAYAAITMGDPETCRCTLCLNFIAARHLAYPAAVHEFYNSLGIQPDREAETYEAGPADPEGRRYYGSWHHFIGRVVTAGERDFEVTRNFNVVFLHSRSCAEPPFKTAESVVQVEFFTKVPWLLEVPPA